jgi:hypothetical protein
MSLMTDAETLTLAQMQWMGECLTQWKINSEVGSLCEELPQGGKMFRFMRYDVKLEVNWLRDELGLKVSESDAELGALPEFLAAQAAPGAEGAPAKPS